VEAVRGGLPAIQKKREAAARGGSSDLPTESVSLSYGKI
jgi:hypothetical protein